MAKTTTPAPKPGYKTTEFWLTLGADLIAALMASGMLAPEDSLTKALTYAGALLATLGYTACRAYVKATEAKASALKG